MSDRPDLPVLKTMKMSGLPCEATMGTILHTVIIVITVLIAYGNSIHGSFQFSDFNVIVNNPAVQSWDGWFGTLRHMGIRPLLKFSYTLSWMSGLGVTGFHLFNIAVHGASSLLVYFLSIRCVKAWDIEAKGGWVKLSALFTAILFTLHPVHTEAVTYISGRSSSLMTLFFLGSLLAYIHGVNESVWIWSRVSSPLLFMAAVATKEVAIVLPLALLLWDTMIGGRSWKRSLKDQWVHWVVLLVLMTVILSHPRYLTLLLFSSELRGIHENLISQIDGFSYLISRLIFVNRLSIDPDIAAVTRMDLVMWVKVGLPVLAGSISIMLRKMRPWLLFAFLWFFIAMLPSNSIIARLDVVNERHLYLADFGVFLAVGCEAGRLLQGSIIQRRVVAVSAALIYGLLLFFTLLRNNDYRSEVSLWESTVRLSPNKARGFNNLGCAYELAGLPIKAAKAYETALRIDPLHENARLNLEKLKSTAVLQ